MGTFYKAIQAEILKVKRNLMFLMLLLMPLIVNLIMTIFFMFYDTSYTNFWTYYTADIFVFYILLYPATLSLIAFVYVDIEMKCNCNKQLFYLPIKPYKIYLAKCTILFSYYTISFIIAYLSFVLSIYLFNSFIPEINASLQSYNSQHLINAVYLKSYIIILPTIFLQYSISSAVPKVWLPCTLAFFLYCGGWIGWNSKFSYLLPNASLTKMIFSEMLRHENVAIFDRVFPISILYTLFFLSTGYFTFRKIMYRGE